MPTCTDSQLFEVLAGLSAQLRGESGSGGVTDLADGLDQARPRHRAHHRDIGKIGVSYDWVEAMKAQAEDSVGTLTRMSGVEDIDLPLPMRHVGSRSALGATVRLVPPSLVDFLR